MEVPKRKNVRLPNYDYSTPGYYFITICTWHKRKIFGNIDGGDIFNAPKMSLSVIGGIAELEVSEIEKHYQNVIVDKYTIMPNHIHMIIRITERINPFPTMGRCDIPNVVGKFKAAVTRNVGKAFMPSAAPQIWQSSFHDHIIRGEKDYLRIWQYIDDNPAKWAEDCFYIE